MIKFSSKKAIGLAVFLCATTGGGAAMAAPISYTFDKPHCASTTGSGNCNDGQWSSTRTYNGSDGSKVTVSGWANTKNSNKDLELGKITQWSGGLGVKNADAGGGDTNEGSSPEHAVDNNDRIDLVKFVFDKVITLNFLDIDWFKDDADVSILAYVGNGSGDINGLQSNTSKEELTSNGWKLIGNFDVDSFPNADMAFDAGGVYSNQWIISAYNPIFGTGCDPKGYCQLDGKKDYFKIDGLGGTEKMNVVPLPAASWLLMAGIGGLGVFGRRRRA